MTGFESLKNGFAGKVIFDTDLCCDVDDVGALFLLLDAAKKYRFELAGIAVNVNGPEEGAAVLAMLREKGMTDVPVGVYDGENPPSGNQSSYVPYLASAYDGTCPTMTATELYDKVLTEAADGSVSVISVGFFNNLNHARAKNAALFDRKVKAVVAMAGRFDAVGFSEFNVVGFPHDSKEFIEGFGGEMIFGGFEIGNRTLTDLRDVADSASLLVKAYGLYTNGGLLRESWDPLTVDFAVNGENEYYCLSGRGKVAIAPDLSTVFTPCAQGNCRYILLKKAPEETGRYISRAIKKTIGV